MAEELKQVSGIDVLVAEQVKDINLQKDEIINTYAPLVTIATTPENLAERKKDKASITKKKKAINDERIAFEKKWKEAIAPISDAYKEVTGLLSLYEEDMKVTLEQFEIQRVKAKQQLIESIFFDDIEKAPEIADWVTLSDIYNPKWENATYAEKDIKADMEKEFATLKISYDNICMMHHDYEAEGLKVLKESRDFQKAVMRMNELSEQQKLIEARQKAEQEAEAERLKKAQEAQEKMRQEEARKAQEAMSYRERAEMAMNAAEQAETPADFKFIPDPEPATLPFGKPTLIPVYSVKCVLQTSFQLELLKHFLEENNIRYEVGKEMVEDVN